MTRRRLTHTANRIAVWLYRRWDGRLSSGHRGVTVLVITVPGRRTGRLHSTCVRYLQTPDGPVVWGTGSGSRREPDWFRNLRATGHAEVQIGSTRVEVSSRELAGAARDAMWTDTVLARAPEVAKYARKAGRTIPVAVLHPLGPSGGVDRSRRTARSDPGR